MSNLDKLKELAKKSTNALGWPDFAGQRRLEQELTPDVVLSLIERLEAAQQHAVDAESRAEAWRRTAENAAESHEKLSAELARRNAAAGEPVATLYKDAKGNIFIHRCADIKAGLTDVFTAAQPTALPPEDYFSSIVFRARQSAEKAMVKFPQPNYVLLKVAEKAGEVAQAGVHYAEGRETWEELEGEVVQTIAMLYRLVIEGDLVNGVIPPERLTVEGDSDE